MDDTIFYKENFVSSFTKITCSVFAFMHGKNDIKVSKLSRFTFLDKFPQKWNIFALNIQSDLSLTDIRQDKTKKNQGYT